MKVGESREDVCCCSKLIDGVDQITARLLCIRLPFAVHPATLCCASGHPLLCIRTL